MRHVATTIRSTLAATVLVGSLTIAGVALAERSRSGSDGRVDDRDHRSPLVQVPSCWGTPISEPTTPPAVGGATQTVTVRIEPTSLLKLDSDGHVIAAETNTGCAPRPTDRLYVVLANGNLVESKKFDVSKVDWTGDFTQFGFIPQLHD